MSSPRTTKVTRGEMLNTQPVGIRHVTDEVHGRVSEQDHTGTCTKDETSGEEETRTVVLKKTKMVLLTVLLEPYIQYGAGFKAPLEPYVANSVSSLNPTTAI